MILRPAAPGEDVRCAALYEQVARETFTWLPRDALTAKQYLAEAEGEVMHLALDGERLLGFSSLWRPDSFLHSLYVDAGARGRGVGAALLAQARAACAGPLSLKVQKLNAHAIGFYRRHGMAVVGAGGEEEPGGGWFRMADAGRP